MRWEAGVRNQVPKGAQEGAAPALFLFIITYVRPRSFIITEKKSVKHIIEVDMLYLS